MRAGRVRLGRKHRCARCGRPRGAHRLHAAAAAVVLAMLLAGCTSPARTAPPPEALELPDAADTAEVPPSSVEEAGPAPNLPPAPGRLVVVARSTDGSLLEGARVVTGGAEAVTDDQGTAVLAPVGPGRVAVTVEADGHRPARAGALVRARGEAEARVTLLPLAAVPEPAEEDAAVVRYVLQGHYDCTATYLIVTGDCMAMADGTAGSAGAPVRPGDHTGEAFAFDLPLDLGWSRVAVTLTWDAGQPGQERMLLALGPTFWAARDHAPRYADAEGPPPLALDLEADVRHPNATTTDMPQPLGGDVLRVRALPLGLADRPAGTRYLGVGASVDHGFTMEVVVARGG